MRVNIWVLGSRKHLYRSGKLAWCQFYQLRVKTRKNQVSECHYSVREHPTNRGRVDYAIGREWSTCCTEFCTASLLTFFCTVDI